MFLRRLARIPARRFLPPAAAFLLLSALCPAQGAAESGWEIVPFAGYHAGGGFEDNASGLDLDVDEGAAFGLILAFPDTVDTRYEFFYGFQRTNLSGSGTLGGDPLFDLDIHYFHLGGSYRLDKGTVQPFVAGGLGATFFSPRGNGPGSKTYFSLSLGGGAMVPISGPLALRIEGRGFLTILPEDSEIFCVSSGGASCRVDVRGDVFGQFLLLVGVAFSL